MTALYPLFLTLFLIGSAYREVCPIGNPWEAAGCASILLLLAYALFALFRSLVKDAGKAALITTITLFTLGLSRAIADAVISTHMHSVGSLINHDKDHIVWASILGGIVIVAILLIVAIIRTKRNLRSFNQAVSAALIALLLTTFGGLWFDPRDAVLREATASMSVSLKTPECPPDIYFIILDAHTSFDGLRDFWKYESKELPDFLRKKGFQIAFGARSDYMYTTQSLASRLNLRYTPAIFDDWGDRYARNALIHIIRKSAVPALLSSAGYKIINLSMTPMDMADARYSISDFLCFQSVKKMLLDRSLFSIIPPLFRASTEPRNRVRVEAASPESARPGRKAARHKTRPLTDFEAVAAQASVQPRFIFVHSLITHEPFLFNPDGSLHAPIQLCNADADNRAYLDQLRYVDQWLIQVLTRIIENASRPSVIILQGDHGFRHFKGSAEDTENESYCMLNAILLPGSKANELPDTFSPVNTFRLVFNHVFAAGLPYLTNAVPRKMSIENRNGD